MRARTNNHNNNKLSTAHIESFLETQLVRWCLTRSPLGIPEDEEGVGGGIDVHGVVGGAASVNDETRDEDDAHSHGLERLVDGDEPASA